MHFIHHHTILRPANEELANVDINVHLGIPVYKKCRTFTSACRYVICIRHVPRICVRGGQRSVEPQGLILIPKQKTYRIRANIFLDGALKQTNKQNERNSLEGGLGFSKLMLGPH